MCRWSTLGSYSSLGEELPDKILVSSWLQLIQSVNDSCAITARRNQAMTTITFVHRSDLWTNTLHFFILLNTRLCRIILDNHRQHHIVFCKHYATSTNPSNRLSWTGIRQIPTSDMPQHGIHLLPASTTNGDAVSLMWWNISVETTGLDNISTGTLSFGS